MDLSPRFSSAVVATVTSSSSAMNVEGVSDTVSGFLADLILGLGGGGVPEYVSQHFLTFILFFNYF